MLREPEGHLSPSRHEPSSAVPGDSVENPVEECPKTWERPSPNLSERAVYQGFRWWRGQDLNLRPSGYETDSQPLLASRSVPSSTSEVGFRAFGVPVRTTADQAIPARGVEESVEALPARRSLRSRDSDSVLQLGGGRRRPTARVTSPAPWIGGNESPSFGGRSQPWRAGQLPSSPRRWRLPLRMTSSTSLTTAGGVRSGRSTCVQTSVPKPTAAPSGSASVRW